MHSSHTFAACLFVAAAAAADPAAITLNNGLKVSEWSFANRPQYYCLLVMALLFYIPIIWRALLNKDARGELWSPSRRR